MLSASFKVLQISACIVTSAVEYQISLQAYRLSATSDWMSLRASRELTTQVLRCYTDLAEKLIFAEQHRANASESNISARFL